MVGWLGWGAAQQHQGQRHDEVLLAAGRQAAVDLTNVDYTRIDADIERILASATGTFRDDFQKTAADFAGAITQAQSSSVGTVTDVGIESSEGDRARVLVAVSVTTRSAADVGDPEPRGWRMRVTVERAGDETKVADVEFVP
jgi:Mce-associated membrane protein